MSAKLHYKIVYAQGPESLEEEVNEFIAKGYQVTGGVTHSDFGYLQAMTKKVTQTTKPAAIQFCRCGHTKDSHLIGSGYCNACGTNRLGLEICSKYSNKRKTK